MSCPFRHGKTLPLSVLSMSSVQSLDYDKDPRRRYLAVRVRNAPAVETPRASPLPCPPLFGLFFLETTPWVLLCPTSVLVREILGQMLRDSPPLPFVTWHPSC